MKHKFLSLVLAAAMVLTNNTVVFANTANTPTSFTVNETQINGTPFIRVPASMPLVYDDTTATYSCSDTVTVYGQIDSSRTVNVFINKQVVYTNTEEQGAHEVNGYTTFGQKYDNEKNILSWTPDECRSGVENGGYKEETAVKKEIRISVLPKDIKNVGNYSANIEFTYNADVLGMYSSINSPNGDSLTKTSKSYLISPVLGTNNDLSDNASITGVYFNSSLVENINLQSQYEDITSFHFPSLFGGVIYGSWNTDSDGGGTGSDIVRTVELSKDLYYFSDVITTSEKPDVISCFYENTKDCAGNVQIKGCPNLQTIIIPSDVTSENFRRYTVDGANKSLLNSVEVTGDATVFIKDMNESNRFLYIPNIVFRGTTGEWKALSGHSDWTFGNMANIVTVYCTNGELIYQ